MTTHPDYTGPMIVMVKVDGCGFCHKALPEFVEAANRVPSTRFVVIDHEEPESKADKTLADRLLKRSNGYPTIARVGRGDKVLKYFKGDLNAAKITQFASKRG